MATARLSSKLTRAGLWALSGKIGAKLLDLPALIVLTHLLTQADFGLVAKAMSVILVVEAITELPLGLPILRISNPTQDVYDTAFTLSILRGIFLFLLVAALAWPLSLYFKEPRLPPLILVLSLAPIFRGIGSPKMAEFMRIYNLRPDAIAEIVSKGMSFVMVIFVAYVTRSYWALAAGTVSTTFFRFAYTFWVAPYRPAFSLRRWPHFLDILGWNSVVQILQALAWQMDAFLLGRALKTAEFGQFAVSSNLNNLTHQAVAMPLARPMAISLMNAEDDARRSVLWLQFSNTVLFVVGPILLTIAMLSDVAVRVLLGAQWQDSAIFLFGLSLAGLAALPGVPLNDLAISLHRSRVIASRALIQLLVMFPLLLAGIYFGGAIGVLVAKGVTEIIMLLVTMRYVRGLVGLSFASQAGALVRSVIGLAVLAAALYLIRDWFIGPLAVTSRPMLALEALLTSGVAMVVYLATTCVLWWYEGRPNAIEKIIVSKMCHVFRRAS